MSFTKIPILFQQLFMKKLMILFKSFVSLMSTRNFFFLRLDHFITPLNTSSVIICLEFVFSNLRLTVSEDLLPLSVQESPNLLSFRVLSLNFVTLLVTCVTANNGFHRSTMICVIFNVEVRAFMRGTCLGSTLRVTCVTPNNGFPRSIMICLIFNVEVLAVMR